MRLFDAENPTEGVVDDTPAFDKSQVNERFKDFKMEQLNGTKRYNL